MSTPAPKLTRDMTAKVLRHHSCAWCGVVTRTEVLERLDGDHVCPECADKEHARQEAGEREDDCCGGSGCGVCCGGPRWV